MINIHKVFLPIGIFCIILSAFILSVAIRVPFLNKPLNDDMEWVTAHTLITQQIWYDNGAWAHQFLPLVTFQHNADRNISNQGHQIDKNGNYYYTSYSPFCFILPYCIFRAFNIYPDVLPLEIFNIAVGLICCLFIFWIVSLITRKEYLGRLNISALVGMGMYLFAPEALIYHANVYFADILVQLFFLMGIYFLLRIVIDGTKKSDYVFFGISNFLMVYTEWLGVFFSFAVVLYAFLCIKEKGMKTVLVTAVFSLLTALALIVWQYSLINGFNNLLHALFTAYQMRSGIFTSADRNFTYWNIESWKRLFSLYVGGYWPFLFLLFSLGLIYFVLRKYKFLVRSGLDKTYLVALYLCLTPVILHHLAFFNHYVIHNFSILKDGVFISILMAFFYHKISLYEGGAWKLVIAAGFILAIIFSINAYFRISYCFSSHSMDIGKEISMMANKNDVVFLNTDKPTLRPQVVFYAHRNIALWKDVSSAKQLLRMNKSDRAIVFILDKSKEYIVGAVYVDQHSQKLNI